MKLKYKDLIKALNAIEDERRVPEEVVLEALKEAMSKAYKKDAELSDISVETEINERRGTIDIYQLYTVTNEEDIEDDELQMSLEDAREINPDAQIGDTVRREVEISTMSRAAATLARNVIRQKIREAEKVSVYNEYINQLNEMVLGIVESVKDKFVLVNLGKTVAMMPKSNQIPNERLTEGQKLRVVITEVNKESKGPQVLVSRSSEMLVKRLFEKEVPEIYQGVVEIKAIARDAGERTKMAVVSHNEEIDPIGACIGQRGGRVQEIIEELHGEKIDIFLWSEDITQLVKNALAPASIEAVLPDDEGKGLLVIVNDDQLSLAIGRKGKNARLAVKLCDKKIDIKTRGEIEEMGKDYDELIARAAEQHAEYEKELARKREERKLSEAKADEEKRQAAVAELIKNRSEEASEEPEDLMPEEMKEVVKDKIRTEMAFAEEDHDDSTETLAAEEVAAAPIEKVEEVEEQVQEEPEEMEETVIEEKTAEEAKPKRKKADLEAIAQKNDYVSAFEKFANTSKPKQEKPKRKKRKSDDEDIKVRNKDLANQLRKDLDTSNVKPVYTDEELEEIERQEMLEEESQYDIDYDEYEDYYNDEDNN